MPAKAFARPKSFDHLHPSSLHKYGVRKHADVETSDRAWRLQQDGWRGMDGAKVDDLLRLGAAYKHVLNNANVAVLKRLTWDDRNEDIEEGCYLRVFVTPRRYTQTVCAEDVRAATDDFVVVRKPRNLPSVSRVDNLYENVQHHTENILGAELWPVQRLDEPTQGLILFARNLDFCKVFNRLIQQKEHVEKCYSFIAEAASSTPTSASLPPDGTLLTHYMDLRSGGAKRVADECEAGGCDKEASLIVLGHAPVPGHPRRRFVQIQLLTGRTHQIRAQFAHIGWPLAGDCMYHPDLASPADLDFLLKCYRLAFTYQNERVEVNLEPEFSPADIEAVKKPLCDSNESPKSAS
ncbi:RNA pseudouridine synthase 6, chloroplastic [Hondaea fermentalgiana]|uniref:RNA pseudouridine synthase 6, chloroplastic n=1 Tax=Hondaea fermentalgiana TaxID=2315210 RepID=A0A2R5GRY7_9STRA|nr:RNA pseudouridine synthase 6, chloroplastic [Hondaea fermentalgiana]|eukprot:GBG30644.1 RNA pseudouridine synthase 6, chloroplastic [Hondaea fermentalgiana]